MTNETDPEVRQELARAGALVIAIGFFFVGLTVGLFL
jgi:hypothetical protein